MMKHREDEKRKAVKGTLLHAYFTSLVCLILCVTMFFGTTYAWFTSEVNNSGNEIYIGTLAVELEKLVDGKWASLSELDGNANKINLFDRDIRWEPGCTVVETVRVVDEGDLAFGYSLRFTDGTLAGAENQSLQDVAQWFEVWVYHDSVGSVPAVGSFSEITAPNSGWVKSGSLAEVLNGKAVFSGNMNTADVANKKTAHTYSIALHMKGEESGEDWQSALNSLMGRKISLNVKLIATQQSGQQTVFQDLQTLADGLVEVTELGWQEVSCDLPGLGSGDTIRLDTAYQFVSLQSNLDALCAPYKNYHADFVVRADKDVAGGTLALAGYCKEWCRQRDDQWVVVTTPGNVKAGEEIRLVKSMGLGAVSVTYEQLCRIGNDGGFLCGIADLSADHGNDGTKIVVELRLYETEAPSAANGYRTDVETGRYVTIGICSYTFQNGQ